MKVILRISIIILSCLLFVVSSIRILQVVKIVPGSFTPVQVRWQWIGIAVLIGLVFAWNKRTLKG